MKLATFDSGAGPRLGAATDTGMVNLTATGRPELSSMLALIEAGQDGLSAAREAAGSGEALPLEGLRFLAPIPVPPQIRDASTFPRHIVQAPVGMQKLAADMQGQPEPDVQPGEIPVVYRKQPIFYITNRFSVQGHDEDVLWPRYSQVMDFELEVACVIGRGGKNIARERALDHVFGYTIFNDFSARDTQLIEMGGMLGPAKGKSFDGGNVLGPVIVTADEVPDPRKLKTRARINGETYVDTDMSAMLHGFDDMIAFISRDEALHPGEVIGSGTVNDGCGLEHSVFLNDGDVVELEVDGIGILRNRVRRQS
ncbi:2-keto-4-pentenoate hydratase/2-oxohepta-3-ene-1,7-dioic acid hydratase (catechol pathway) [Salinihabitans flavidus]|uniref:2-keto-4-pentenoate hydratase/2-oxohepta-3-ene-1,7-dioic acid hydratase (Catechol pathway) n=1 Tax=Salinihabitans flavidus TaxID=569882 RepID=A0A1H8WD86_9RHOB|nr:fumarylacetoacetate hydrolase family protein [Salinihabitans flavidus]SEP25610.1 2-keto-4-pentenoate hydratase/2-oxohepta-3-ene-1,7-dioic acid hydratase (catechol pathway) [Salinihabitans flavidus]